MYSQYIYPPFFKAIHRNHGGQLTNFSSSWTNSSQQERDTCRPPGFPDIRPLPLAVLIVPVKPAPFPQSPSQNPDIQLGIFHSRRCFHVSHLTASVELLPSTMSPTADALCLTADVKYVSRQCQLGCRVVHRPPPTRFDTFDSQPLEKANKEALDIDGSKY